MIGDRVARLALFASLAATACHPVREPPEKDVPMDSGGTGSPDTSESAAPGPVDADGDGYAADQDCDDGDPDVNPGAIEVCNDRDDDCDGGYDEGLWQTWWRDGDRDGYGDAGGRATACDELPGYVTNWDDCDDADDGIHPGAAESACDGIDQDCDGCDLCEGALCGVEVRIQGEHESDLTGARGAGDVDGDGVADLVFGSIFVDVGASTGGAVYVVDGPVTTSRALSAADVRVYGEVENDHVGSAGAGDVDGDGIGDLVVGAEGADGTGAVGVFYGPVSGEKGFSAADAMLLGEEEGDDAGHVVVLGDVSGDGLDDLVVGAYSSSRYEESAGIVYVVDAPFPSSGNLADATASLYGEDYVEMVGQVIDAGDLDGDGIADVILGMLWESRVLVHLGPLAGARAASDADATFTGREGGIAGVVSSIADVDGDGTNDLLVGDPDVDAWDPVYGEAYVLRGPAVTSRDLADADAVLVGEDRNDGAGAIDGGDVDGDGLADLVVSADDGLEGYTGTTYLLYSPVSGTVSLADADARWFGERAFDDSAVSMVTDADADGLSDILVYANDEDREGLTYVLFGGDL